MNMHSSRSNDSKPFTDSLRKAFGVSDSAAINPSGDLLENPVVPLAIELLLNVYQAGLSSKDAGCLFLLLGTNLLEEVPAKTIQEMVMQIRQEGRYSFPAFRASEVLESSP
jgi:hypothetical protein